MNTCPFLKVAERALIDILNLSARDVTLTAMNVVSDMYIYRNKRFDMESMKTVEKDYEDEKEKPETKDRESSKALSCFERMQAVEFVFF